jgi:hypothetical protein
MHNTGQQCCQYNNTLNVTLWRPVIMTTCGKDALTIDFVTKWHGTLLAEWNKGGGEVIKNWMEGLLWNITHEIVLKNIQKWKMALVVYTSGPDFQLAALWFPDEQATDWNVWPKQWTKWYVASQNMAAHKYLPILFCCINSAHYCQSNRSNTSAFIIYSNTLQKPVVGKFWIDAEKFSGIHKINSWPMIWNAWPSTHVIST